MINSKIFGKTEKKISFIEIFRRLFVFPRWQDALLALLSAVLLILAFPDFELWFLAWFALVPLLIAIEKNKDSGVKSFWLGLLSGTIFFYGTCWWLTYAPIHYGGLPAPIVYFLLLPATFGAGFFVGIFAAILARLLSKFGNAALLLAPFIWASCEFLRLLITGNAWNALGYSFAFNPILIQTAKFGGVYLIGFLIIAYSSFLTFSFVVRQIGRLKNFGLNIVSTAFIFTPIFVGLLLIQNQPASNSFQPMSASAVVIALQPNVPMSGLTIEKYYELRKRHVEMAENALLEIASKPELKDLPRVIVFPESPMNFAYAEDSEFRDFLRDFGGRNKISLLFNAGEPTTLGDGYHNSAVMVNERGEKVAQYDKIRLVPFGEFVPEWLPGNQLLPTVVGRMKPGKDFRLMPFGGEARAGILICYESAFGDLSNEFVRNGADFLVELTNDGYGGDTPILRQHLANAVFRAVETNRPVLRVTNTGITAYINERGEISDATETYKTDTRIWTVTKSDGKETFYVRNGDLFAWICVGLSLIFLVGSFFITRKNTLTES